MWELNQSLTGELQTSVRCMVFKTPYPHLYWIQLAKTSSCLSPVCCYERKVWSRNWLSHVVRSKLWSVTRPRMWELNQSLTGELQTSVRCMVFKTPYSHLYWIQLAKTSSCLSPVCCYERKVWSRNWLSHVVRSKLWSVTRPRMWELNQSLTGELQTSVRCMVFKTPYSHLYWIQLAKTSSCLSPVCCYERKVWSRNWLSHVVRSKLWSVTRPRMWELNQSLTGELQTSVRCMVFKTPYPHLYWIQLAKTSFCLSPRPQQQPLAETTSFCVVYRVRIACCMAWHKDMLSGGKFFWRQSAA